MMWRGWGPQDGIGDGWMNQSTMLQATAQTAFLNYQYFQKPKKE
jgi:hypothetical protein